MVYLKKHVYKDIITFFIMVLIITPMLSIRANHLHVIGVNRSEDYEYVIITQTNYINDFQQLANWKTEKGVASTVVDVEWIYNEYTGSTSQDKIQIFIQDAYLNWGKIYFL